MTSAAVDGGTNIGTWRGQQGFLLLNFVLLVFLVPPLSLLVYYSIASAVLAFKSVLVRKFGPGARPKAIAMGVISLTVCMLALRDPNLFGASWSKSLGGIKGGLAMTVGLSYCWLRTLYVVSAERELGWLEFTRYYFFMPTYLSGPVLAPDDFLAQRSGFRRKDVAEGILRIAIGGMRFMFSVIVQQMSAFTGPAEMLHAADRFGPAALWASAVLSGIWLYLNFAAFTDLYIGLGRLFGVRLPENFDNPLAAENLTDFWQRWHITLGNWLRSMVFTPLAKYLGNWFSSNSLATAGVAAVATMAVCGVWHKPTLGYLVWGILHGLGLFGHQVWVRFARPQVGERLKRGITYRMSAWLITQAYVACLWVFFFPAGNTNFDTSLRIFFRMLGMG